jgi:hypothetical protein
VKPRPIHVHRYLRASSGLTGICGESSICPFCCVYDRIFRLPKREKKPPKAAALIKKEIAACNGGDLKPEQM